MSMLLDNLKDVEERIQAACDRSGRKREDVLLVAVSKTKPVEMIEEVMTAGIVDFGENKPQELRDKYEAPSPKSALPYDRPSADKQDQVRY